ncbi:MAG: deoxyribonuclease IV [Chlamydiota bacterium]
MGTMQPPLLIGAHTSTAGGLSNALIEGESIGATTIQLFTSNQKQWRGRILSEDDVTTFHDFQKKTGIHVTMSHDSYLINLGSPDPELLEKSRTAFKEEILRCQTLGITYLNFHPGAFTTGSKDKCLDTIVESLLILGPIISQGKTKLLLETTAGQGSSVGSLFEELAYIINHTQKTISLGVCIDTCHIFSAGYDIRTAQAWDATLMEFDNLIGLKHLSAFHLNDSKHELNSHKDRHANLGKGFIGLKCFEFLMQDPRTKYLPKYLETPDGALVWKEEIALLKQFAQG